MSTPVIRARFAKSSAQKAPPTTPVGAFADRRPESAVPVQGTYVVWLQRWMLSLDAVVQDGHHHALPGVASPPGPSDGERRRAARGAVPAPLRSKGRDVSIGGVFQAQDEGDNRLTGKQPLSGAESRRCSAPAGPVRGRPEVLGSVESTWRTLGTL